MDAGEPEGVAMFQEGTRTQAADSHLVYAPFYTWQAAAALLRLGRLDDARATLAEAFRQLETTKPHFSDERVTR